MFNRLEFLELFDNEKITDEDIEARTYSLTLNDLTFNLSICPIYNKIFLSLYSKNLKFLIYEVILNDIESIQIDRNIPNCIKLLIFVKKQKECIASVMLKPEISLQCESNMTSN